MSSYLLTRDPAERRGPIVRIGLATPGGSLAADALEAHVPALVSANALFDHKAGGFRPVPWQLQYGDVALDSAGFVAMTRYGRFPWTLEQYAMLSESPAWTWFAQMDYCCEPEIARDRAAVRRRVFDTAQALEAHRAHVFRYNARRAPGSRRLRHPMPVLQGWLASDYLESARLASQVLRCDWPELVGIGSVCRRSLEGPAGIRAILRALEPVTPPHVRFHLFGIKGAALRALRDHPRIASVDSMAFEFRARVTSREAGVSRTIAHRFRELDRWLERNATPAGDPQLSLSIQ